MGVKHKFKVCDQEFDKEISRSMAIKYYCKDCSGDGYNGYSGVATCPLKDCPLWPYRTGKVDSSFNVKKKKMSEKQKKAAAERMRKLHAKGKLKK